MPHSSYPLTRAVMHLVQTLLNQHCTWGLVPSLVHYTLNRVLGAMPWLPFSSTSDRWAFWGLRAERVCVFNGPIVCSQEHVMVVANVFRCTWCKRC